MGRPPRLIGVRVASSSHSPLCHTSLEPPPVLVRHRRPRSYAMTTTAKSLDPDGDAKCECHRIRQIPAVRRPRCAIARAGDSIEPALFLSPGPTRAHEIPAAFPRCPAHRVDRIALPVGQRIAQDAYRARDWAYAAA